MGLLADTVATIVLVGRNETAAPFAEAMVGLRSVQAEADKTGAAMARAGGSINGSNGSVVASSGLATKSLEAEIAASIKAADITQAQTAKALEQSARVEAAAQRRATTVARSYQLETNAAERAAAQQERSFAKVTKGAGLLSLGILAIGYETSKMAAGFERDMEMVRTQAGASQAEVNRMSGAILALSGEVGTGPDKLAQSLYHVESAGFRGAAALDMVRLAAEGAKVGNADLEATTQAVIGVMSSQIGGIHNATDAMAFLNATVGAGDMRMQQLDLAIATGVLPSFRNFGLNAIDAGAAIATLTDNVTPADEAATRLRMTISLMGAPSAKATTALAGIGLSATQLASDMRKPEGLLVAVTDLKQHLEDSGKTAVEQSQIISHAFGGGRTSAAIETLLGEFDKFKSKYAAISAGQKKFTDDWNATTKTTAFQAAQAKANVDALGISVGQGLVPAVDEFLKVITPAALALAKFTADNKTLVGYGIAAVGTVAGVVALVGAFVKTKNAVLEISKAWKAVESSALAASAAEKGATLGGLLRTGAGAALANPITAIAAVSAIGAYKENQAVQEDGGAKFAKLMDQYARGTETIKQLEAASAKLGITLSFALIDQANGERIAYRHAEAEKAAARAVNDVSFNLEKLHPRLVQTSNDHAAAAGAAHAHTATLKELDEQIKKTLSSEIALTNEGLKKEESAFTSMADHAISEAARMKAGVEASVKAMNVAITKSVSWSPLLQPSQITTTTATPTQFATSGLSYNPKGAETLDPALGKDMGDLSRAIDGLPPKLQATWDARLQKEENAATNLYNKYLADLNKENRINTDHINSINADYHAKVAQASKDANSRESTLNAQYLEKLDAVERAHNDRLAAIQNEFLTGYQRLLVGYQAAISAAQVKAEADATKHEDRLRELAANEAAALAAVHGKNAAERREQIEKQYARDIATADANYGHTVTANENHVKGLSKTFDDHIKQLTIHLNAEIKSANTRLASNEKNLAKVHADALAGLDRWLKGRDTKAEADREKALLKLAGIHLSVVDGIISAFDQGGKKIGQAIDAALAKLPDLLKESVFANWASPQGNHTFLGPGTPIGSMPSQSLGGGAFTAPSLTQVQTDSKSLPYIDPNSAREATLSAALTELQHQSVLVGQQTGLSADDIKIQQDKNRVDAGNAKLALDYLKYIALQSDPKATQADKTNQLQLIKGDVNANVENAGQLAADIGQAVASAEQAVHAAQENVIAANSAVAVGLLQAQVTELADLTSIMQAQANIRTAEVNGQIAAINDQSAILQAEYGVEVANGEIFKASDEIQKATDSHSRAIALAHMAVAQAQLRVAQDEVEIARVKAEADRVAAAWAVKIAEAEAHMAQDKLHVDKANAEANNAVANAHLAVANQQLKIAMDNAKLTADIAENTGAMAVEMGADPANIAADKAALGADTAPLQGLMDKESAAQLAAQGTAAQGAYTLGQDQAGITGLQIGATSDSQNYALQLASLTAKQGTDNIDLQRKQAASAALTASNTTTANTLLQNANDALQERNDALTQLIGLMAQGVSWNGVGGDFKGILDTLGMQVHVNK